MRELRGKKAVITGAAGGIGRAIARALAKEGTALYLLDINATELQSSTAECRAYGIETIAEPCDLEDAVTLHVTVNRILRHWGHVDILVNNAGVCYYGSTRHMTDCHWDRLIRVNLLAPVQLTRELLPTLLERNEAHVINVCSIVGLIGAAKMAAYSASKFALVGFSQALFAEYGGRGLSVTALCPGLVRTGLMQTVMRPATADGTLKPPVVPPTWTCTTPERVAAMAVHAIRARRGLVVLPASSRWLWRIHRLAPSLLPFLMRNRKWGKRRRSRATDHTVAEPHSSQNAA